ncbi:hypothetical protein JCM24511_06063 [Saitozyma sp. JCM 24511]|nr:hypothetical protein JCM24511_06063 [Saitozyma sp. JCM 24511]
MGNCMSSGTEQNFAEQQRVRALAAAAAAANGPRGYPAPGQQPHAAPAAPNGPTVHYAVPPQTQQANGAAPATFNPMTGTAPNGGPTGAFSPPTSPPAGHFPPGAMSPGAVPPGGMATGPLSPGATPAGGMPPSYFPPGAGAAGGGPTIANDPIMNGIHGSGSIARKAGEVLIISYDLGTTASGCAYIYREADGQIGFGPEVVDQWPGQTSTSLGKTPSVLFYNQAGQCQEEWGAQCLAPQWSPSRLAAIGLHKVEWYKLHIDPSTIPIEHMSGPTRQLPPGVSAFQVYTDYMQKLHAAAVTRFQTRRGADLFKRLTTQDRVQYILTIPAAWQKPAIVGELRRCAFRAGLIKDEQSTALDFCSEPEASALECYAAAKQLSLGPNDTFSVVDAGGGTVDFTTYQVLTIHPTFTMKEVDVGAVRCLYRGGTFVDRSFEEFLQNKLSREYPATYQERHLLRGMREFTASTKIQFSHQNRQSTFLQLSDDDEFNQGCIELQWHEIEQCFKPHVDAIIEVAKAQVNTIVGRCKVVFCSGGFGSNDYLRERSPAWYGVKAFRTLSAEDRRLPGAVEHTAIGKTGKQILDDTFSVVLPFGDSVGDDEWKSSKFSIEISDTATNTKQGKLMIYQSPRYDKPIFVDDAVKVVWWSRPQEKGTEPESKPLQPLLGGDAHNIRHSDDITVLLSLGRADLRSRVIIDGVEAGGATITWAK